MAVTAVVTVSVTVVVVPVAAALSAAVRLLQISFLDSTPSGKGGRAQKGLEGCSSLNFSSAVQNVWKSGNLSRRYAFTRSMYGFSMDMRM